MKLLVLLITLSRVCELKVAPWPGTLLKQFARPVYDLPVILQRRSNLTGSGAVDALQLICLSRRQSRTQTSCLVCFWVHFLSRLRASSSSAAAGRRWLPAAMSKLSLQTQLLQSALGKYETQAAKERAAVTFETGVLAAPAMIKLLLH